MSIEIRHILFTPEEVIAAVQHFGRTMQVTLPSTIVTGVEITGDGFEAAVTVSLRDKAGKTTSVAIPANDVLSLVIRLCIQRRIPLPVGGTKHLFMLEGRLGLAVYLSFGSDENLVFKSNLRLEKRVE